MECSVLCRVNASKGQFCIISQLIVNSFALLERQVLGKSRNEVKILQRFIFNFYLRACFQWWSERFRGSAYTSSIRRLMHRTLLGDTRWEDSWKALKDASVSLKSLCCDDRASTVRAPGEFYWNTKMGTARTCKTLETRIVQWHIASHSTS